MPAHRPFEADQHFTQEEFAEYASSYAGPERVELINGRIVMNPPSGWPAGEASASVASVLHAFVSQRRLGRVFGADQGFELPSGDTVGPDTAFVSNATWSASSPHEPGRFLRVVPELVVEVLSEKTSTYDRGEKKDVYASNGVSEYWVIDSHDRRMWRFELQDGRYGEPEVIPESEQVVSSAVRGFSAPLVDLLPEP